MEDTLKPCPFCGGEAEIYGNENVFWGKCYECGCELYSVRTYQGAVEEWNRRVGDAR